MFKIQTKNVEYALITSKCLNFIILVIYICFILLEKRVFFCLFSFPRPYNENWNLEKIILDTVLSRMIMKYAI